MMDSEEDVEVVCHRARQLGAPSEPSYPKTSELLELMRSPDANERADALAMLSEVVGTAFGEAGAELAGTEEFQRVVTDCKRLSARAHSLLADCKDA